MRSLCAASLLLTAGCHSMFDEPKLATVSSNPFGLQAESRAAKLNYEQADEAVAMRVDAVGRKLLHANPQMGLNPKTTFFATIGKSPHPEVFHIGLNMVYVTDGLVQRCPSDPELAAVLAYELGKIVAKREAAASPDMRNPDRMRPIQVPIGNAGQFTNPDLVSQVELGKYEQARPKSQKNLPRPHPEALARGYLESAGFVAADLDSVQPLLQEAQNRMTLERQFKGLNPGSGWQP
jgi:hypothetical protein